MGIIKAIWGDVMALFDRNMAGQYDSMLTNFKALSSDPAKGLDNKDKLLNDKAIKKVNEDFCMRPVYFTEFNEMESEE